MLPGETVPSAETAPPGETAPSAGGPSGQPVTICAMRNVPPDAVRDPAPAAAIASRRSSSARAALNACTHSGER